MHILFMEQSSALWLSTLLSKLPEIAHRQWLFVTVIGLLAFLGSAAVGLIVGIREPTVHDEFSYLLAGDRFVLTDFTERTHPISTKVPT